MGGQSAMSVGMCRALHGLEYLTLPLQGGRCLSEPPCSPIFLWFTSLVRMSAIIAYVGQ